MGRRAQLDVSRMSEFARWLLARLEAQGMTLGQLAAGAGVNESYLHKILKSYLPQYRQYRRPSYDKTAALGRCLGDASGALAAAGYDASGDAGAGAPPASPPLVVRPALVDAG